MVSPSPSPWEVKQGIHRLYLEARIHHNSYFEKLAILDGGTVALVITAILGPLHGIVRHRYTLGVGLTLLVAAMLILLARNFFAAEYEFHVVHDTLRDVYEPKSKQGRRLEKIVDYASSTGVRLSVLGIALLVVEVWFILV